MTTRHIAFAAIWLALILVVGCEAAGPAPTLVPPASPVPAIFGEQDTQGDPIQGAHAWRRALEQAGHPYSRVQVFPGSDHLLNVTETGCIRETNQTVEQVVRNQGYTLPNEFLQDPQQIPLSALPFVPGYLDLIEEWLRDLPP